MRPATASGAGSQIGSICQPASGLKFGVPLELMVTVPAATTTVSPGLTAWPSIATTLGAVRLPDLVVRVDADQHRTPRPDPDGCRSSRIPAPGRSPEVRTSPAAPISNTTTATVASSRAPSGASAVQVNADSPTNGPGTCTGVSLEPVNAPQRRKIVTSEMTVAHRSEVTALSSPKVTVLRAVTPQARVRCPEIFRTAM